MTQLTLIAELSFRGRFPIWLAVTLLAVAAVGTILFYARETVKLGIGARSLMAGLRIGAFALLAFLLLRPVWVSERHGERPRPVALLLDNSQSLTQEDPRTTDEDQRRVLIAYDRLPPDASLTPTVASPGDEPAYPPMDMPENPSRADVVREVFSNPRLDLRRRLEQVGPVQAYLFGQRLRQVATGEDWLAEFTNSDSQTGFYDAGRRLLDRDVNQLPTAVVAVTDGRDNASSSALASLAENCKDAGVPFHIYGVGASTVGVLQLKSARIPDTVFIEDTVEIPVRWRVHGFDQGTVELSLRLDGRPVGEPKRLPVQEGEDLRETLTFTPTRDDIRAREKQPLEVVARLIQGGDEYSDRLRRRVSVEDGKIKVLVIENIPRWDFKFLQRALLRDHRVDADFILIKGEDRAMRAGRPYLPGLPNRREEFFEYDLLIIGDVPADYLGPEHSRWVSEFATEGRGVVVLAGRQNAPATWAGNSTLAELLPVEFEEVNFPIDSGERTEPYQPQLTPAGERTPMLILTDRPEENKTLWSELPGWHWHYPVTKLRPGAVALLTHPQETIEGRERGQQEPMPLMAVHNYGRGRVLFLGTDETWRWRYNEQDRHFGRFWGQIIYRMGYRPQRGQNRAQMMLADPDPVLGTTGRVYAHLLTEDYQPLSAEVVSARLEKLNADPGEERFQTITL